MQMSRRSPHRPASRLLDRRAFPAGRRPYL